MATSFTATRIGRPSRTSTVFDPAGNWSIGTPIRYSASDAAAGMQFSRGCPLRCTYCGQWSFWKRWRHRSPENFVGELATLARRHGVRIVWLADENFAADPHAARRALELLAERDLGLSLYLNLTAADVVRDAKLLPLYKKAGVDNVIMGVESLDDATVAMERENNPLTTSQRAVALLREHGIVEAW